MVQGASGYTPVITGNGNNYKLRIHYDQQYDIENNQSTITLYVEAWHRYYAPTTPDGIITVNGNVVKIYNLYNAPGGIVPNGSWVRLIGDGTCTINHNQDGTASITIGIGGYNLGGFGFRNESYSYTNDDFGVKSWDVTLTTIPRASVFSAATNKELGQACSLNWIPNSAAFAYKIRFSLGNWSETTGAISPNQTTEYTYTGYTIPMEVANQMPNTISGTMTATIYTYTDASCTTQLGNESSISFIVTVPVSVVPTILSVETSLDNSANDVISGWGLAVAGYTKVKLKADVSGAYSSTIVSFIITGGYNTTVTGSTLDYTGDTISSSGEKTFTIKAVDSRGRISSEKVTSAITFYAYANPQIASLRAGRLSDDNKKVSISMQWSISSVNSKNSAKFELKYKKLTSSGWNTYDGILINGESTTLSVDFDTTSSYNFRLLVQDAIGNTCQEECLISTMDVLLDFRAGGKGLGIGKICESDALEISLPVKLSNTFSIEGYTIENMFPVGYVYISFSDVSPAQLFGGTWERLKDVFLLAAGDSYAAGTTGGEAEHTLTENGMPRHRHDFQASYSEAATGSETLGKILAGGDSNQWLWNFAQTNESGWNAPHNNMPPYLAVYMWARVE